MPRPKRHLQLPTPSWLLLLGVECARRWKAFQIGETHAALALSAQPSLSDGTILRAGEQYLDLSKPCRTSVLPDVKDQGDCGSW